MPEIDYKQLLEKYMALVIGLKGFSFLERIDESYIHDQTFTDSELQELRRIEQQIGDTDF